jgi:glycerol dehydrogenase
VAFGVLAGLFLTDRPKALVDEVYRFCETVGLPTTLAQIGLADVTEETIRHEPCPISPRAVLAALKTADEYGKRRN